MKTTVQVLQAASSDGGSGSSGGSSNDSSGSSNGSNSSGSSSSSSSSGGSSRSYTYRGTKKAAQWAQDSRGWRFQNADETYVTNRWIELSWNEKSAWYRFNEQGYMVTGWFKDGDGNWYFMNDRADGTQGAMVTGWHQIAGKWYYFRVTEGGPVGSLVMKCYNPGRLQSRWERCLDPVIGLQIQFLRMKADDDK